MIVELRSDTVTRPTAGMRAAIARAEVGDDVFRDDPTVIALQQRIAALSGKEAAITPDDEHFARRRLLALGAAPAELARGVDSVSVGFSKGLGAPAGSALLGHLAPKGVLATGGEHAAPGHASGHRPRRHRPGQRGRVFVFRRRLKCPSPTLRR